MERVQLSKDLTFQKIFSVLIFVVLIAVMAGSGVNIWYVTAICAVAAYVGYSTIYQADNIEFDKDYMYISTRNDEVSASLAEVYVIKLTMTQLNRQRMWKVKYKIDGIEKAARFYPSYSPALDEFIQNVQAKNPDVKVSYSTNSFDLDS